MERRGQAAMEFLMTYGWAILAAIVVIAVLAIYFRPSQLVSNTAVVSAPFNVLSQQINNNDAANCAGNDCIRLELKNNGGDTVTVSQVAVTISGTTCATAAGTTIITASNSNVFNVNCGATTTFGAGSTVNGDITITYTSGSGTLDLTSTGNIAGKAQ